MNTLGRNFLVCLVVAAVGLFLMSRKRAKDEKDKFRTDAQITWVRPGMAPHPEAKGRLKAASLPSAAAGLRPPPPLPPRTAEPWTRFTVVPSTFGLVAIRKDKKLLYNFRNELTGKPCDDNPKKDCVLFTNGQEVLVTPQLRPLVPAGILYRHELTPKVLPIGTTHR